MSGTIQGMCPKRLQRVERFIDDTYVKTGKLPGALVQVFRRGELVLNSAMGFADRERQAPLKEDSIFRIYSMTKPITSVALMMLVEEGKIALDEPVAKYIPSWASLGVYVGGVAGTFRTRPPARPMQVVDLFRHTSGLTYGFQMNGNVDAAYRQKQVGDMHTEQTLDDMIETLAGIPLEFSPGEAWNYSVSTDVLGYLVGKVSGMPFETFLKERIFDPLGMVDTGFQVPADKVSRFCACYAIGQLGTAVIADGPPVLQDDPETSPFLKKPTFVSGGGGLVSTAHDYMRFARMALQGGELDGHRLLGPKTLALMTANHLPGGADLPSLSRSMFSETIYEGVGFGLGFATTVDPSRTLVPCSAGDFYWGGAASTSFWIDPQEELIALFLTQVLPSTAYPVRRQLRTLIASAIVDSGVK